MSTEKTPSAEGFYEKNKNAYEEKIIDYSESPSGKAYVGVAKRPLMAVKNGHGFMGVLLQSDDRKLIQCHGCGKWFQGINSLHTKKCLNVTVREYKERFGLYDQTGLVSDERSMQLTTYALKAGSGDVNRFKGKRQDYSKRKWTGAEKFEHMNEHGTCPAQLRERLYEFIRVNKEMPSRKNRGKNLGQILIKRYGSLGHAFMVHGLPRFYKKGLRMHYEFPDGTKHDFNIRDLDERRKLFEMMMHKCPVLA